MGQTDSTTPATSTPAAAPTVDPAELKARDDWFTQTPDPWQQVVVLEFGGDRTFATTIERMVIEAEPAQRPGFEARLVGVLERPELTDAGLQFACRMLALIGTRVCVPAVQRFLRDGRTSDAARLALDVIDDPAVDGAYREALPQLQGRARIGLIGSIGLRSDREAIGALRGIAADANEPAEVRQAAERAVGRLETKS